MTDAPAEDPAAPLRRFTVAADAETIEALSDALLAGGALAVCVEDAEADTDAERPLYGEPGIEPTQAGWGRNRIEVLCAGTTDPQELLRSACERAGVAVPELQGCVEVADADWVRLTQAQFAPTRVCEGLWVVPSWHESPEPAAINLRIDPGAAFGTGTHPTTRLCLRWLARELPRGSRVLDYGCGSGILAIAAARLGAAEVVGTDIDEKSLDVARDNSRMNAVANAVYTAPDELPRASGASGAGTFDVVLANILAMPLIVLAPALSSRLRPGGSLVLSGILERQAAEVRDAYLRAGGPTLEISAAEDGWVCLAGIAGR